MNLRVNSYNYSIVFLLTLVLVSIGDIATANSQATTEADFDAAIYSADIETEFEEVTIHDGLEAINRPIYQLNKGLDTVLFKPTAQIYRAITPVFARDRATDFLHNLSEPVHFVNFMLQGNPEQAGNSLGRFIANTTFGIGGVFDIAKEAGLEKNHSDFGLTLGNFGIETGNYLVLPILGPSSTRDLVGTGVDVLIDPFTFTTHIDFGLSQFGSNVITKREALLDFSDNLEKTTLDEYSSVRSIYFQKREVKK